MTATVGTHDLTESGWTVLVLGDEMARIDETHIEEARGAMLAAAEKALATDSKQMLLDLSRVEFFGSSFIEVLFNTHRTMKDGGGRFAVCGCSTHCREVMEITRLDSVWNIFADRESAVSSA